MHCTDDAVFQNYLWLKYGSQPPLKFAKLLTLTITDKQLITITAAHAVSS